MMRFVNCSILRAYRKDFGNHAWKFWRQEGRARRIPRKRSFLSYAGENVTRQAEPAGGKREENPPEEVIYELCGGNRNKNSRASRRKREENPPEVGIFALCGGKRNKTSRVSRRKREGNPPEVGIFALCGGNRNKTSRASRRKEIREAPVKKRKGTREDRTSPKFFWGGPVLLEA
ncbi:MAG: hypothetical protein K5819_03905 [Lachnospiraceae bacterium]|nr:hypothetical protein [Lachnospiraceae bacterium]